MNQNPLQDLSSADLLAATRALVRTSCVIEADLLLHLAEIDERKLYAERASPSMFAFCVDELGFSEDAAYYRITVARAARRFPAIIDAIRSGRVHLAGLRVLVPHLTEENHRDVLTEAAGRSKRQIDEIAARLSPQPPVAAMVRKVVQGGRVFSATSLRGAALSLPIPITSSDSAPPVEIATAAVLHEEASATRNALLPRSAAQRAIIAPLSADTYKVQFTATTPFRDKLRRAQDLLRHRIPDGNIAAVMETALDLLLEQVMKERFAVGRKPRAKPEAPPATAVEESPESAEASGVAEATSRHIPDEIRRMIYERDGGRCTFVDDERGVRCSETGGLEIEHEEGFAITHQHDPKHMCLRCRTHNQYAAEQKYGREFMERARRARQESATRPGASSGPAQNDSGGWSKAPPSA
jgi:hypothetical protein